MQEIKQTIRVILNTTDDRLIDEYTQKFKDECEKHCEKEIYKFTAEWLKNLMKEHDFETTIAMHRYYKAIEKFENTYENFKRDCLDPYAICPEEDVEFYEMLIEAMPGQFIMRKGILK